MVGLAGVSELRCDTARGIVSLGWRVLGTHHPPTPGIPSSLTQAELCGELPLGSRSLTISRLLWYTATCSGVRPF